MNTTTDVAEGKIVLERQEDGNWVGKTMKFGKVITVREVGPETALLKLLTHSGEE